MTPRTLLNSTVVAVLAVGCGLAALATWRPMVEDSTSYLHTAALSGVLIVVVGLLGRASGLRAAMIVPVQALVLLGWFTFHFTSDAAFLGFFPTSASLQELSDLVLRGGANINTYVAPVPREHTAVTPYLALCGSAVLLGMDLLACSLRKPALTGLVLLVTVTVPIAILNVGIDPWIFAAVAGLFLALLSTNEAHQGASWAHAGRVRRTAFVLGVPAIAIALIAPVAIPMPDPWLHRSGGSDLGSDAVSVINPMIDMKRDLTRDEAVPMMTVTTKQPDPAYVRTTVLDVFQRAQWAPSERDLPPDQEVDGTLPYPPGLNPSVPTEEYAWSVKLTNQFQTPWLPLPFPASQVKVPGDWRFDAATLDVVNVGAADISRRLSYQTSALVPAYDRNDLMGAPPASSELLKPMTDLPNDVPQVVRRLAKEVTQGAANDYQRAIALQQWFREVGGFRYSLKQRPGTGLDQLVRFITVDKVGYCEQFAAAMAVMARSVGMPTRVSVGFLRPSIQRGDTYTFTTNDLHAWVEVYFNGSGWVRFDPTPASRTGAAPSYAARSQIPDPSAEQSTPAASPTRSPGGPAPSGNRAPVDPVSAPNTKSQPQWQAPVAAGAGVVLLLGSIPFLLRHRRRRRRLDPQLESRALANSTWAELRDTCLDLGFAWPGARSPRETMRQLLDQLVPQETHWAAGELLVDRWEQSWYAGAAPASSATTGAELLAALEQITGLMRTQTPRIVRWRATLLPISLVSGNSVATRHRRGAPEVS